MFDRREKIEEKPKKIVGLDGKIQRKPYRRLDLDLGISRTNEKFIEIGSFIFVVECDGDVEIKLDDNQAAFFKLAEGGFYKSEYKQFWIKNTAQAGKSLTALIGDARFFRVMMRGIYDHAKLNNVLTDQHHAQTHDHAEFLKHDGSRDVTGTLVPITTGTKSLGSTIKRFLLGCFDGVLVYGDIGVTGAVDGIDISVQATKVRTKVVDEAAIADGKVLVYRVASGKLEYEAQAGGVTDHGALTGLADDDHTQYLNTGRHDLWIRHALGVVVPHDNLADLTEKSHASLAGVVSDQHSDTKVRSKEVDEGAVADGKVLVYRVASGKLEYENPAGGAAPQVIILMTAIGSIAQYDAVAIYSTPSRVSTIATVDETWRRKVLGIASESKGNMETIGIIVGGKTKARLHGSANAGDPLSLDDAGRLSKYTPNTTKNCSPHVHDINLTEPEGGSITQVETVVFGITPGEWAGAKIVAKALQNGVNEDLIDICLWTAG